MVGGTLAHAYFPPGQSASTSEPPLPIHFDEQGHRWVDGAVTGGFDIETVAVHQIGHTIGLLHSADPRSVMFPLFSTCHTKRELTPDDLRAARLLYPPGVYP